MVKTRAQLRHERDNQRRANCIAQENRLIRRLKTSNASIPARLAVEELDARHSFFTDQARHYEDIKSRSAADIGARPETVDAYDRAGKWSAKQAASFAAGPSLVFRLQLGQQKRARRARRPAKRKTRTCTRTQACRCRG